MRGNLSSAKILDLIPLSDPYAVFQSFSAGAAIAGDDIINILFNDAEYMIAILSQDGTILDYNLKFRKFFTSFIGDNIVKLQLSNLLPKPERNRFKKNFKLLSSRR